MAFCQNYFCRRSCSISTTIGWVQEQGSAFQARLGSRIRELRLARGYAQEAFADACGLHRTHISLLERGQLDVKMGTLLKVSAALKVSLSDLFKGLG